MRGHFLRAAAGLGGGAPAFSRLTFSPWTYHTLSLDDTRATKTSSSTFPRQYTIAAGAGVTTGKVYTEFAIISGYSVWAGIGDGPGTTWPGGYDFSYGGGLGHQGNRLGGTMHRNPMDGVSGQRLCIACDFDDRKVWLGRDGAYRDGGNPATGFAPNMSGFTSALPLRPLLRMYSAGQHADCPAEYLYAPAGFSPWPNS